MITIFDWFGLNLPIYERYGLIKQAGFEGVMIWWSDENGKADYRLQPQYARSAGLIIENMHTPFEDINNIWLDNLEGEALAANMIRCVEDCSLFEIPCMIMHVSKSDNPPPFNKLGLDRFKRIVEGGERLGVNIAVENTRKTEYLSFVLNGIDSKRIGFCYDSGHHNCHTPKDDLLSMFGSKLMALHLHDNDGSDDQHLLPFDGTCQWSNVMKQINDAGYKGPVALEVNNRGYEHLTPEELLRICFKRAKQLKELMNL